MNKDIALCKDRVEKLYSVVSDALLRNSAVYIFSSWTLFFDEFSDEFCLSRFVLDLPFSTMTWSYSVKDMIEKSDEEIYCIFYKDMIEAIDYRDRLIARFSKK